MIAESQRVPQGYKQTEVGVIPEDWSVDSLQTVLDQTRSVRYGVVQPGDFYPRGQLMLRSQDYSKGWTGPDEMHRVSSALEKQYRNARIRVGDLIMTVVGAGIGQVVFAPAWLEGAILSRSTGRIAVDPAKAASRFIAACLESPSGKRQVLDCQKEGAQPVVSCPDLAKFLVPLPTLAEQEAIAEALGDADALIESLEQLVAKKRHLKQAAMQQLLTGKTRLPGFEMLPGHKQTDVGVIPTDWGVISLEQHAQVRSGIAKNGSAKFNNPIQVPYLRVANVQDGFLDLSEMSEIAIERNNLRRFSVVAGDVLMNEGGDRDQLGRGCVWSGELDPCVHQNHVFVVRCTNGLNPHFLAAYTGTATAKQFFIDAGSQTTNLASINKTAIGKLPIPLPPTLAEQEAIAAVLSDMVAAIEATEAKLAKAQQIKQGMMQELLTGRIRLL